MLKRGAEYNMWMLTSSQYNVNYHPTIMLTTIKNERGFLRIIFNNWIAILALIVSIAGLAWNVYQYFTMQKLSFSISGIENKPILKVQGSPQILSFELKSKKSIPGSVLFSNPRPSIESVLTLKTRINLINEGRAIAKVVAYAVMDKPTGAPEIRKTIQGLQENKKEKNINLEIGLDSSYYETLDILPGDKRSIDFSYTIQALDKEGKFTLHYFFLYANDLENVFDSYYWARYETKKDFKIAHQGDNFFSADKEWPTPFKFLDDHFSTQMYSRKNQNIFLAIKKI